MIDSCTWSEEKSRTDETVELFGELNHTAWQASLRRSPGEGFVSVDESSDIHVALGCEGVDVANTDYIDLPETQKDLYRGITGTMTAHLARIARQRSPLDESAMLAAREAVYHGLVHGKYGNPMGMYSLSEPNDRRKHTEVTLRYSDYDAFVSGALQRTDESIFCLGVVALVSPETFPWVKDKGLHQGWAELPGVDEAELRGIAAITRVVRIAGHATPLQAELMSAAREGR